jgi:8-oxo-dGTP pyrophosphatase MutT (NUDIX family)
MQMYKVFFNDRIIILTDAHEHSPEFNNSAFFQYNKPEQMKKLIDNFIHKPEMAKMVISHTDINKLWSDFKTHFRYIIAAGGLVKNEQDKYLFIFRRQRWDLPKGKAEVGETNEITAIREVSEETGLNNITITSKLDDTYHFFYIKDKLALKQTIWYAMSHVGDEKPTPQTTEDITHIDWFSKNELEPVFQNTFPLIKDVLHSVGINI